MAANRGASQDADGEAAGDGGEAAERPRERYGKVALERLVKDDGRALILFSHASDGGEEADGP